MSKVKINELEMARIVRPNAMAKVHEVHGSQSNYVLAMRGVKVAHGPEYERVANEAFQGLAKTLNRALQGYSPANASNPNITLIGPGGQEVVTPSSLGVAWKPLAWGTLTQKGGGKIKTLGLEARKRKALTEQQKAKKFWWKIWRHRRKEQGLYDRMRPALAAMAHGKVAFIEVSRTPMQTTTRRGAPFHFRFALVFPKVRGDGGILLDALATNYLIEAGLFDLRRSGPPPGYSTGIPNSDIRAILHPEYARPMIRPLAAAAGRRMDVQLRRLRK